MISPVTQAILRVIVSCKDDNLLLFVFLRALVSRTIATYGTYGRVGLLFCCNECLRLNSNVIAARKSECSEQFKHSKLENAIPTC